MKVIENRFKGLLLLSVVLCLTACIPTRYFVKPEPVEGVIMNYETGEPIPDAFVVARWTGTSGGLGHGGGAICFHVEVTKSDAVGRYYIPPPEIESDYPKYREPQILITSYKPGFRRPYEFDFRLSPGDQLSETDETSAERMDYLHDVVKNTSCPQARKSRNNYLPLYEALYADAIQTAETKEDKEHSLYFLRKVESITLEDD
jgi:hypothetical protein